MHVAWNPITGQLLDTSTAFVFMTWVLTLSKWSGLKWIIPNPKKTTNGHGFIDYECSFNPYLDRCVNEGPQTLAGARRPTRWARRWSQSLASKHLHPCYRSSARSIHPASVDNRTIQRLSSWMLLHGFIWTCISIPKYLYKNLHLETQRCDKDVTFSNFTQN